MAPAQKLGHNLLCRGVKGAREGGKRRGQEKEEKEEKEKRGKRKKKKCLKQQKIRSISFRDVELDFFLKKE